MIACRKSFTDELLALAKQDKDIIAVTSDARGSVTLGDFAKELPGQFVECGIDEQDAVGISAGLAHSGKKVFACGPACFYVARSLEQVKVDMAYSQNPVTILGVSGGIAYGALGVLRTFPGMTIFIPADGQQTKMLVRQLVDYKLPAYVRVGRAAVPEVYPETKTDFEIGKAIQLHDGDDLTIIACGEPVWHALEAAKRLENDGIQARVIDMSLAIKPCDREAVVNAARETGRIITVEEHSRYGGLGGMVAEIVAEEMPGTEMTILGIPDENAVHGTDKEIRHYYGLDADGIYDAAKE